MKPTALYLVAYLTMACLLIAACSSSVKEDSSPISFDEKHINQEITLTVPNYFNTFKPTDAISVEITNNSSHEIVFHNDYNIRLFLRSNNEWAEIAEAPTTRLPAGAVVLSPNAIENTYIMPELPQSTTTYYLRIYVFGSIKGNSEIAVAAFTDLVMDP